MLLEIRNIKQPITDDSPIEEIVGKKLRISSKEVSIVKILKKSVDARKKDSISFIYSVLVDLDSKRLAGRPRSDGDIAVYKAIQPLELIKGKRSIKNRPIIVGSGPAGLFAGLILAENGYRPLLLERGKAVEERTKDIERLFNEKVFDEESNIQFGEGGAGTFSDGKLTTRIKDMRCDLVLKKFVEFGAPHEIEYLNKPHIGTDILKNVVVNMRNRIIELGGEVRFSSKVTRINIDQGEAKSVEINGEEIIESNIIVLALGHSARDTYKMLYEKGVAMIAKPFSIGVRIEHKQSLIDEAQYGSFAGHEKLGAADYLLSFKSAATGRTAYSFCMCPGGMVVAAASEKNMVVTNGMSEYKRDRENANSALVVSVSPEDFDNSCPLSAVEYQRRWETLAYKCGGGDYVAPVQLVGDFLKGNESVKLGNVKPSYMPGVVMSNMENCLPDYVISTLKEALLDFDRKIKGFASYDAVMTGVETRTSAPLRIIRNESMESENIKNLYPIGEGAGYAGGIVSAAVDGIKLAEKIIQGFKTF